MGLGQGSPLRWDVNGQGPGTTAQVTLRAMLGPSVSPTAQKDLPWGRCTDIPHGAHTTLGRKGEGFIQQFSIRSGVPTQCQVAPDCWKPGSHTGITQTLGRHSLVREADTRTQDNENEKALQYVVMRMELWI